ncbi:MAG TPA: hypothetical protein VGG46_12410, partial [Terriglobales bacterium]
MTETISSSFNADKRNSGEINVVTLMAQTIGLILGVVIVVVTYACEFAWKSIAVANGWIVFFLVAKPLIDLTWRWEFIQFSEQRVNVQAIVGICIIVFASVRIVHLRHIKFNYSLVLTFLGIATFSVLYSPSSWGFNELIRLYSGIAFFFVAFLVLSKPALFDRFAFALIGTVTIPVVLAFLQVAHILPFDYWDWIEGERIGRASGSYNTPLGLVYFLMYTIPLTLYLLEYRKQWWLRISLGGSLLALVFTYHRTAFIAISTQLILWFILKKKYKMVFGLFAIGIVCVVMYAGAFQRLYEPLTDAIHGEVDITGDQFLRGRGLIWATFLTDYVQGDPINWLIGRGGSVLNGSLSLDEMGENDPHNDFVRI